MKKHDDLLSDFSRHAGQFLATSHQWRQESSLMYQIYDNRPITGTTLAVSHKIDDGIFGGRNPNHVTATRNRILSVVSVAPPYLKATLGMMAQYRKSFVAHSATEQYAESADIVNNGLDWGVEVSQYNDAFMDALTDSAVTGLGGLSINVRYDNGDYPVGVPISRCKRQLFYDRGAEHGTDIKWCGYADPVDRDALSEWLEKKKALATGTAQFNEQFLEYSNPENRQYIDFIQSYFYRQHEKVMYLVNPITNQAERSIEVLERNPITYEFLADFGEKHSIDYLAEPLFVFTKEMARDWAIVLKNITDATGLELPETNTRKGEQEVFYRAIMARGQLIEHERSFCQSRHELCILPAYYDRYSGTHYGLMRGAAYMQEMINEAMENFREQVRRNTTGGTQALIGAGTELKNIIRDVKGNEQLIALPPNAALTTLSTPDAAQANQMLLQMLIELVPVSFGISKEILGQMNTDTPAASLFQAAQKQMQTSLAHLMSNVDGFVQSCGYVMRDAIKHIVRESDAPVSIRRGQGSQAAYKQLEKQQILQNYHVTVQEQDLSKDQRHEEFIKLVEFVNTLAPEQRPLMLPAMIESSTLDYEQKQTFLEALQGAQQPNPEQEQAAQMQQQMQIEQMQANIRMINAQAAQLEQQSGREQTQAELNQQKSSMEIDKAVSDIGHKQAQTVKTEADAAKVIADIGMQAYNAMSSIRVDI